MSTEIQNILKKKKSLKKNVFTGKVIKHASSFYFTLTELQRGRSFFLWVSKIKVLFIFQYRQSEETGIRGNILA